MLRAHLTEHPGDGQGYYMLGTLFAAQVDPGRAGKAFEAAIHNGLDTAETQTALATVYFHLGHRDKAEVHLDTALQHDDTFALARLLSARLALKTDPEEALSLALALVRDDPELFDPYPFLAGVYRTEFGDLERAQVCLDRATGLDASRLEVLEEQAGLYFDYGMPNAARLVAQQVLDRAPQSHAGVLMMALAQLALGNFKEGWSYYARRREHSPHHAMLRFGDIPLWDGEDASEQTVLVWTDQSVGDEILYSSMLPDLAAKAGKVVLACSPRMAPVFERSFPDIEVIPDPFHDGGISPKPTADVQICLPDLGLHFRQQKSDFPDHASYLVADPDRVTELRQRYLSSAPGNQLVGLSWRSGQKGFGTAKSSKLMDWRALLECPEKTFVCLQYGDINDEVAKVRAEFGIDILIDPEVNPLKNMDLAMAQVAAMDQVVSTSNTTVHMSAAQGRPTFLALPQGRKTVWCWGISGDACPFYPSLEIVRRSSEHLGAISDFESLIKVIVQRL